LVEVQPDLQFEHFVREHVSRVARYVNRRGSGGDTSDVVQEVFMIAWQRREHLATSVPVDAHAGWLCGVARRVVARCREQTTSRSAREVRAGLDRAIANHGPNNLDDRSMDVRNALAALPTADVDVLTASYWDDLDGPSLAAYLGTTEAAARQRRHRALGRLRQQLSRGSGDV